MKHIIIAGTTSSGKSTTIDNVCKKLNPSKVLRLKADRTFEEINNDTAWENGTYILHINEKIILAVSGSPTEQALTITTIVNICITFDIKIDIAIVAMRTVERRDGHNTPEELAKFGECLLKITVSKVEGSDYQQSQKWQQRIEQLVNVISGALDLPVSQCVSPVVL